MGKTTYVITTAGVVIDAADCRILQLSDREATELLLGMNDTERADYAVRFGQPVQYQK